MIAIYPIKVFCESQFPSKILGVCLSLSLNTDMNDRLVMSAASDCQSNWNCFSPH
ncbi:hypothetical protein BDQ94DRAFT_144537 [Aspergillus welwitschiae]|uniref:Uncharacterized protein n=1 Tax=Aspergillus welwitschiae TaxID=1341132 RepID=A0A3F3Q1W2_9EURO|nr:hypothetical protein BDQ94DRAFT_144537 [Aspergillus welwitschiae]RDH33121.1 hypothetical protein BDQ94DRAFT_144537 [Aspergillus welwitschiae]